MALLIGTAIVTEPSVSFSSSGNRGCAPAGTETPLRLQTNTLSISAPGIVKASYLTMLSPSVSGKVDKVHPLFNVGEIVLKGTPLMELENLNTAPDWRTLRRNWNRPAWMFLRSRRKP